jgi:hypothetical protein
MKKLFATVAALTMLASVATTPAQAQTDPAEVGINIARPMWALIKAKKSCDTNQTTDFQYNLVIAAWNLVPEETKRAAQADVDAKIKEVGLQAFCDKVEEIQKSNPYRTERTNRARPNVTATALRWSRDGDTTRVLLAIDNKTDEDFRVAWMSCVYSWQGAPLHEETEIVQQVLSKQRTIKTITTWSVKGRFDDVSCRLIRTD